MNETLFYVFLFIIGAACGSFVGAFTWRMKKKMNWVSGRSICEKCKKQLAARDMVPILSWIFLRGRCRYCGKKIGVLQLLLELIGGIAFLLSGIFWPLGFSLQGIILFVIWLVILVLFFALAVYDARWKLLPNKIMFPLIFLSFIFLALRVVFFETFSLDAFLVAILLSLIPISGVYGILWLLSRGRLVGLGDAKLGVPLAFILATDWRLTLLVLFLANFLGTIATLPFLIKKKLTPKSQIPFGPWLILAGFIAFFWGEAIIAFFTKNLLLL